MEKEKSDKEFLEMENRIIELEKIVKVQGEELRKQAEKIDMLKEQHTQALREQAEKIAMLKEQHTQALREQAEAHTQQIAVLRSFMRPYVYLNCREEFRHSNKYFI